MDWPLTRRGFVGTVALTAGTMANVDANPLDRFRQQAGWVQGRLTGAQAVAETLKAEGTHWLFGIPGAQENELWDEFKSRGVNYQLVAHEFAAACMADGYARATGRPGVICVVPGPGVTNAMTGLGEALLDSTPIVAIVGDIANGEAYHSFQVHSLNTVELLKPVTKAVYPVTDVRQIPAAIREAFRLAVAGEPGPVAVTIPFNLLIEKAVFDSPPLPALPLPYDIARIDEAIQLLSQRNLRVGIYAGLGCMNYGQQLTQVAEMLQAPVATSVSGKGCINETHPLAVGWGYAAHASRVAEKTFVPQRALRDKLAIDILLAIGVKFSEVSTGFYGNPRPKYVIHVDACADNIGKVMRADVGVHADAGLFLGKLLQCQGIVSRPANHGLVRTIATLKQEESVAANNVPQRRCGYDPLSLIVAMRRQMPSDAILFTDVTVSEHLAAEHFTTVMPRTFFNPVNNQSMGWSVAAAIGAQRASPGRVIATLTGDGCMLMAMQELSTAAHFGLPVKWFLLDDRAYHYMQMLQESAYKRTTATILPKLDYAALAQGYGVGYYDIPLNANLDVHVAAALQQPGPVLVRVPTDYGERKIRWIEAVRDRFVDDLSAAQKARFLARIAKRSVTVQRDD